MTYVNINNLKEVSMSRSYRKPYAAITGTNSAKQDKIFAHRGERRAQKKALRNCQDYDEFLIPDRLECSGNDTWSWGRDGSQYLHFPPEPTLRGYYWWMSQEELPKVVRRTVRVL